MGNARIMAGALDRFRLQRRPTRLLEFGAGDGHLLSVVARHLGNGWRGTTATLLDRQPLLSACTVQKFGELGWNVQTLTTDVFDWYNMPHGDKSEVGVVNLVLHHFDVGSLERLFEAVSREVLYFVAVEPRRSIFALWFSRMVGFIGCNAVTRHDAPVSVRAGFADHELSRLWINDTEWVVRESAAGLFSHLFVAEKRN
jgi:hypothetical protein